MNGAPQHSQPRATAYLVVGENISVTPTGKYSEYLNLAFRIPGGKER
jgi:hypothetical protein